MIVKSVMHSNNYDKRAIHTALGQPNAPVAAGATVSESLENFKTFVLNSLLLVPLDKEEHCVRHRFSVVAGRPTYRNDAFSRASS